MLILYNKNERQFLSNGIGRLDKHAFDDKVREELNGIYKLEFTYPIHAPHSKDIKNDNIVRATVPDGEQPFFISRIVKKDGYLRVTAYHLFYRLIWQLIEDINIVNLNGQAALNRVLENTEFTGVSDIATTKNIRIVRYNAVEAILNPGKDNTLISRFGGELKRDKLTVMLMNRIGRTYENNPVEIRYAKNLLSYEADISDSNVATRVMPIGFDGLLLPEKYVVKPGADPTDYKTVKVEYSSIRTISNPDSPKEGELPLEDAYEALRQAVLSDFESGRFDLKASYQVRFQELSTTEEYKNKSVLEKVYLGDEIKVIHTDEELQILSRVIAYEWSPIRKEYEEVELGSHIETFSDIKPTLELIAGKVEQYKTDWESNVDEITELLTTALGGYVLKKSGELLIMDTEDPSTATKVWRWNLNGLGYSGTGINGPYETAITMDGRIIAKFIYTLNLSSISADLGVVTAGRIQDRDNESYWDLDNKEISLIVKYLAIKTEGITKEVATVTDVENSVNDKATTSELNILRDRVETKVSQQDVQDMIDQINQANPNLITNLSENWEQGTINSTTGILEDSDYVIRSKAYFPIRQGYVTFSVSPLYQALIVIYTNGYAFSQSAGFANQHTFLLPENSYFKMALRRVNSAAIVPDAINTAELKVENSQEPTKYQPYVGDLTLSQQQDYYILDVQSNNGWVVDEVNYNAILTARVYLFNDDVTARFEPYQFTWLKRYPDGTLESLGNGKSKVITSATLDRSATITCEFEILDTIYLLSTYNGDTLLTISNDNLMVIGDYQ